MLAFGDHVSCYYLVTDVKHGRFVQPYDNGIVFVVSDR
jgi:hypothetical protein